MKIGDLVKIVCKDGAISYELGIFLGTMKSDHYQHWAVFFINGRERSLYLFDYKFEVINENR